MHASIKGRKCSGWCHHRLCFSSVLKSVLFLLGFQGLALFADPSQLSSTDGKLITRVFSIPPDFEVMSPQVIPSRRLETYPATSGKSITLDDSDTTGWPRGAGLVINRQKHLIAIRNTEANLKLIESVIAQWNEEWQKRKGAVIYYDEITFAVAARTKTGSLVEVVYLLPSTFATKDLTQELKLQGIHFPEGSSAQWDGATQQATLCNTHANLDLVMWWVASLWEEAKQTPPFQDKAPSPVLLEKGQVDEAMRESVAQSPPLKK